MHDLMFSKDIVRAINEKLKTLDKTARIAAVNIALSPMSHVKPEALNETFKAMVKGTEFEKIALKIKPLKLNMECGSCNAGFSVEKPTFACPKCGSSSINLEDSKEFLVESIEVDKVV